MQSKIMTYYFNNSKYDLTRFSIDIDIVYCCLKSVFLCQLKKQQHMIVNVTVKNCKVIQRDLTRNIFGFTYLRT